LGKQTIELSDIEEITSEVKISTVFDLTEAIGHQNLEKALGILEKAMESKYLFQKRRRRVEVWRSHSFSLKHDGEAILEHAGYQTDEFSSAGCWRIGQRIGNITVEYKEIAGAGESFL
jgi:hypothetical protein